MAKSALFLRFMQFWMECRHALFLELPLKRIAIFQIRLRRFRSLILRMSSSQNRCALSRDTL